MDDRNAQIGARVKTARRQKGLTQPQLGKLVGVEAATISRYERGETTIRAGDIKVFSEALGVSQNWLLTGEELGGVTGSSTEQSSQDSTEFLMIRDPNEEFILETYREASEKDKLYIMGILNTVKKASQKKS